MTVLTEEQKLVFIRDGYLILPQIISMSLIQAAVNHCDAAYSAHHYNLPKSAGSTKPTPSFWRSVKSASSVTDLFFKSDLLQVAEQLFGARNVHVLNNDGQIAYTLPDDDAELGLHDEHPAHKWHIDTPLGDSAERGADFALIVGVALSEGQQVDENRGQFIAWAGSHVTTHATMRQLIETHEAKQVIAAFKARKPHVGAAARVLVGRGDAFIAHQRLAHAPGVNAWSATRKNVYFRVRHARHDELLAEFSASAAPWVGFDGIADVVQRQCDGSTLGQQDGRDI